MLAVCPLPSVTVRVAAVASASVVNVPEMTPLSLMVMPCGRFVAENVYGSIPPLTAPDTSISVMVSPTFPAGRS